MQLVWNVVLCNPEFWTRFTYFEREVVKTIKRRRRGVDHHQNHRLPLNDNNTNDTATDPLTNNNNEDTDEYFYYTSSTTVQTARQGGWRYLGMIKSVSKTFASILAGQTLEDAFFRTANPSGLRTLQAQHLLLVSRREWAAHGSSLSFLIQFHYLSVDNLFGAHYRKKKRDERLLSRRHARRNAQLSKTNALVREFRDIFSNADAIVHENNDPWKLLVPLPKLREVFQCMRVHHVDDFHEVCILNTIFRDQLTVHEVNRRCERYCVLRERMRPYGGITCNDPLEKFYLCAWFSGEHDPATTPLDEMVRVLRLNNAVATQYAADLDAATHWVQQTRPPPKTSFELFLTARQRAKIYLVSWLRTRPWGLE